MIIWNKVFKGGLSKFRGRHPLRKLLSLLFNTLSHLLWRRGFILETNTVAT